MPKSDKPSAGRRPPPGASPVGAGAAHSASATSVATFTTLTEAQWEAIRSTRNWPGGRDWRGMIETFAQRFWEAQGKRNIWVKKLRGKRPAREKDRVYGTLLLTRRLQRAWAKLADDDADFVENGLPDPGLKLREQRLEAWLSDYEAWVTPFVGKSDPFQEHLEWQLMMIWIEAGGKPDYSRKKDDSGTPYGPLVDFFALTLEAVLGKTYQPSGIATMIDRHRPEIARARAWRHAKQ
jgi:hypothetical protein